MLVLPASVELHKLFSLLSECWNKDNWTDSLNNYSKYSNSLQMWNFLKPAWRHLIWEQGRGKLTTPPPTSIKSLFGPHGETEASGEQLVAPPSEWHSPWHEHHHLHRTFSSPGSTTSCGSLSYKRPIFHIAKNSIVVKSIKLSEGNRWQKANRDCITFVYSLISFTLAFVICPKKLSIKVENTVLPLSNTWAFKCS